MTEIQPSCEHDWRLGPVVLLNGSRQAVCVVCWKSALVGRTFVAPEWTTQDYETHRQAIEKGSP